MTYSSVTGYPFNDDRAAGYGPEPTPAPPTTRCRWHGEVDDDHFPCRRPGESVAEFTARALGETRDV